MAYLEREAHPEHCQTSMMERFCKNNYLACFSAQAQIKNLSPRKFLHLLRFQKTGTPKKILLFQETESLKKLLMFREMETTKKFYFKVSHTNI